MSRADAWTAAALIQPWLWTLLYAGKRMDNRRRKDGKMPVLCRHRGPLLLHASAGMSRKYHRTAARWVHASLGIYVPGPTWAPSVTGPQAQELKAPDVLTFGGIDGIMNAVGHVEPDGKVVDYNGPALDMRWHFPGQFALILVDPMPLLHVPFKGHQGLMRVTDEQLGEHVAAQVRAYDRAHA